jgi:hypothetical protein
MTSTPTPPHRGEDIEAFPAVGTPASNPAPTPITPASNPTERVTTNTPPYREVDERYVPASTRVHEPPQDSGSRVDGPPPLPVAAPAPVRPYGEPRSYAASAADLGVDHDSVLTREKEQFGGIKVGSAFFGWVAAAGIAVLLTSLLTAAGVVLSLTSKTTTTDITNQATAATGTAKTVGLVGAILLLVVLFVAYYCGGYVAARMARFNGATQGLAVWLWGIVFAIVIFILVKIAGSKYNILTNLNLPRIPVDEGSLTTTAIIAIAAIIIVTLGAAVLGGLAGMRFHRNVDKAGLAV